MKFNTSYLAFHKVAQLFYFSGKKIQNLNYAFYALNENSAY